MTKQISIPITFILEKDKETGFYTSRIKEFPQAISQGKTKKEALDNVMDAFREFIEMYKAKEKVTTRKTASRTIEKAHLFVHA
ncbi:MAG TPA: type II toxin-antitoxin system HicB family antitoxin [Bacteroidia bacterium]|jgi:predicted RNase H-like HicB family nuclease|nr:type II toxin-antitoxin system HicB family antitoxin [Bacteroidia bacterium]